jgi:hypothetical protein
MNVSRSAVARFLECDDVMGHFLGFVGDQHKVAVMSLLNKAFARLTQDAGSWKWGSDGFILATHPTRERLRLLRANTHSVRANTHSMWVLTETLTKYCPALTSFYPCDDLPKEACGALAKRLQRCYANPPMLAALEAARAPQLHTLSVCQHHVDLEAFPALTDLTLLHGFEELLPPLPPTMTQRLTRLDVEGSALRGPAMETYPWSLRELVLGDNNIFDWQLTCHFVVCVSTLCPHLVALEVQCDVPWTCEEIRCIALATPLLERFECGSINDDHDDHPAAAANVWPRLESIKVRCGASCVLLHLVNPHRLRRVSTTCPFVDNDVRLLRALLKVAPPLLLLDMGHPPRYDLVKASTAATAATRAECMRVVLSVVGPTLETLTADVAHVDVGRYCPRLRDFHQRVRKGRKGDKVPTTHAHMQRGCPLLEGL